VRPGPCGSTGAHIDREARSGAEEHVTASEPTSAGRRGLELSTGAQLSKEARPGSIGHVAPPEPTSAGRQGPGLQDTWKYRSSPR
jgi:hypothetical protein